MTTVGLREAMFALKMVTKLYELYQWRGDDCWVKRSDACSQNGHKTTYTNFTNGEEMTVQCWVGRRDSYSQNGHKTIQTLPMERR